MSVCLPFLRVHNIHRTIIWYESIGFTCSGTHQEPGCDLDWAMLELDGAAFMLYLREDNEVLTAKDSGLYFKLKSIDQIIESLKKVNAFIIEVNEMTDYGRREVVCKDVNGFQVTFSSDTVNEKAKNAST